MTSKNSKFAKAKNYLTIPAFTALTLIFAEKAYANNMPETESKNSNSLQSAYNTKSYHAQKDPDFKVQQEGLPNDLKRDTTPKKTKVTAKLQEIKSTNDDDTITDLAIAPPPPPSENFVQAEFPGGNNELRKQFGNAFNASVLAKNEKSNMKTDIYISVDENGKTTNIKADGKTAAFNNEAVRTMKEVVSNKTWKPATDDGKPIATVFRLPITFNFQ